MLSGADELAAAQHSEHEVRVQVNGENPLAPIHEIDPEAFELNCDGEQCYLVPDDGNPLNDIYPGDHEHSVPVAAPIAPEYAFQDEYSNYLNGPSGVPASGNAFDLDYDYANFAQGG